MTKKADSAVTLKIRSKADCRLDEISLGEIMLRLDPGERRIRSTRSFEVWAGGGEYNVAYALRRCFGLRTAVVTALADNEVGRLIEECVLQGGVDTNFIRWRAFDGIGRNVRNGLNFTERGFGVRAAVGLSDRGNSAASQLKPGEVDWDHIFGELGVRWFHTGGIFAGLSETTEAVIEEALQSARRHGTVTSFDLNYRPSLWKAIGGTGRAQEVSRRLAGLVDVMVGNEEDFTAALGFQPGKTDVERNRIDIGGFRDMLEAVADRFPNLKIVAATLREVRSASVNSWAAIAFSQGVFHQAQERPQLEIFDRVGGGDGFVSGLIYGLLERNDLATAVEFGAAHGALAMTTPGDTSMASLSEVERLVAGVAARVQR